MTGYQVGDAARIARVSVRTLHHYDEIGLLSPSGRSASGYRLYNDADLERLQQVLFYRELGLPLDEIRRVMTDPGFDRREALLAQRDLLEAQAVRAQALLDAVDKAIAAIDEGVRMTNDEMFEVFGEEQREYQKEAEERWGETDAYKESTRRAKGYTKAEWEQIKAEGDAIEEDFATLYLDGAAPGDPEVQDVVERHRLMIDKRFYPCSRQMHAQLGQMYVADPRFTAHYDQHAEGLAQFVCDATAVAAENEG